MNMSSAIPGARGSPVSFALPTPEAARSMVGRWIGSTSPIPSPIPGTPMSAATIPTARPRWGGTAPFSRDRVRSLVFRV